MNQKGEFLLSAVVFCEIILSLPKTNVNFDITKYGRGLSWPLASPSQSLTISTFLRFQNKKLLNHQEIPEHYCHRLKAHPTGTFLTL